MSETAWDILRKAHEAEAKAHALMAPVIKEWSSALAEKIMHQLVTEGQVFMANGEVVDVQLDPPHP